MYTNIITRKDIFEWYKLEYQGYPLSDIILAFRSISDRDLAKHFNLEILRKGYFYPKIR